MRHLTDVSKTVNFACQKGRRLNFGLNLHDIIYVRHGILEIFRHPSSPLCSNLFALAYAKANSLPSLIAFIVEILNLYIILFCSHSVLCITSFRYLSFPCNAFIACFNYMLQDILSVINCLPRCTYHLLYIP